MKIYNLPISLECIEIFYFKKFKVPKKMKLLTSIEFYDSILEAIDHDMFYVYKIDDIYYSCISLEIDDKQQQEGQLFILNIPNIYIQDNNMSYIVNILDLVKFNIEKNIQYEYKDIFLFFDNIEYVPNQKDNILKIKNIDDVNNNLDNSNYDVIVNNKKTSFIGLNPNTQFIYNNNNITNKYISKIFNILKILCFIEKYYTYCNISIINTNDDNFEKCNIYNIYSKNIKNISINDIMDIFNILKKSDNIFYI